MTPTDPTPPGGPSDQRAGRRVDLRRRVSLKFKDFQGFVNEYLENISAGGMFIRTTSPPPVGTVFDFELTLEDYSRLVHGLGEVVWVRERDEGFDRPAGMGVQFLSLEPESRELIARLLARGAGAEVSMGAALAPPDLDAEEPWWSEPRAAPPEPAWEGPQEAPGELDSPPDLPPEVDLGPEPYPDAELEPEAAGGAEAAGAQTPVGAPPFPPRSPYAYARSYQGSAVARPSRRPRRLLLWLLIVVVLVALAAAVFLLFPDVAMRWLLGDETRAALEEAAAGEPVVPVAPAEAGGAEVADEDAAAGAGETAGPEMGFFEPAPTSEPPSSSEPAPSPPPAPTSVPPPPPPPDSAGAERGFSRVLNVIWEPAGEGTAVTVFLDGPVEEWSYTVERLESPPRAVLRIQGVDSPFPRAAIPVGTDLVERIRLGFHPELRESELHLVLDLATPEAEVVRTEAAGSEIRLQVARNGG